MKAKKPPAKPKKSSKTELGDIKQLKKSKKNLPAVVEPTLFKLPSTVLMKTIVKEDLANFAKRKLKHYGEYVVQDRAVPEFRDGLKPVHRHIIYAMSQLNLFGSDFKKCARIVGDTIGKYHPHGDTATYGALVTLANTIPKLIQGRGNFGSPLDMAAAQRYTEARLSDYSKLFLLDKGYLEVVPRINNFDDSEKIPLYLPSLLPTMLLIGNAGGIAYGVRACNPAFEIEGVTKLIQIVLEKGDLKAADCVKHLKIQAPFGSDCVSTQEELADFIQTGRAKAIKYCPKVQVDYKNRIIEIVSYSPGFASEDGVGKKRDKILDLPEVSRWVADCGDKRPNAGPYGAYYYVVPKRGMSDDGLLALADKIRKMLTGSEFYNLGLTINNVDGTAKFLYCNFATYIKNWVRYRVELEKRYLENIIAKRERDLWEYNVLSYAVINKNKILEVMKKALDKDDPDTYTSKTLKIPLAEATFILELKMRRLAKLELKALQDKIKVATSDIKGWKIDHKDPNPRIASSLTESVNKYVKMVNASIADTKKSDKKRKKKEKAD